MNQSLLERTRELLKAANQPLPELAKSSGLPVSWLKKLRYGKIEDPSVNRIQRLYEFLSGSQIKV